MAFSYDKLWKLLIDKKMTKESFRLLIKASPTTIAAMGKGEGISPKVLERICAAFDCQPGDIMEYMPKQPDSSSMTSQHLIDEEQKRLTQRTEDYSGARIHETLDEKLDRLRREHPTRQSADSNE